MLGPIASDYAFQALPIVPMAFSIFDLRFIREYLIEPGLIDMFQNFVSGQDIWPLFVHGRKIMKRTFIF